MYFEQTAISPERYALQDISREDAEMIIQAVIALKEANYMDPEEFPAEREKLQNIYKQMNTELVASRHEQLMKHEL